MDAWTLARTAHRVRRTHNARSAAPDTTCSTVNARNHVLSDTRRMVRLQLAIHATPAALHVLARQRHALTAQEESISKGTLAKTNATRHITPIKEAFANPVTATACSAPSLSLTSAFFASQDIQKWGEVVFWAALKATILMAKLAKHAMKPVKLAMAR